MKYVRRWAFVHTSLENINLMLPRLYEAIDMSDLPVDIYMGMTWVNRPNLSSNWETRKFMNERKVTLQEVFVVV